MASTGPTTTEHPLLDVVRRMSARLASDVDTGLWSVADEEVGELVRATTVLVGQVAELQARAVGEAIGRDLPGAAGQRPAAWVATTTHLTRAAAAGLIRLDTTLRQTEPTRQALASGQIRVEHATAIGAMLDQLDRTATDTDLVVGPDDKRRAEEFLLAHARSMDAKAIATLGQRIVETLDPAGAEAIEAQALEAQEKRAAARARLSGRRVGDGMVRGSFLIPEAHWSMLLKPLQGLAAPKHVRAKDGAGAFDWTKPSAHKLGEAFMEYLERFPADKLPRLGGASATVVAVGDYEILLGKVKAAHLDTGVAISPALFIKLAAANGIIPTWMDTTTGTPRTLDLGRRQRFHSPDQRLAKTIEAVTEAAATGHRGGPTCQTSGCDTPAYLCHLHHGVPWQQGGTTNLTDAQHQCPYHHHRIHSDTHDNPGDDCAEASDGDPPPDL